MEYFDQLIKQLSREIREKDIKGVKDIRKQRLGAAINKTKDNKEHLRIGYNLRWKFSKDYAIEVMRLQFDYEVIHELRYCFQREFKEGFLYGKTLPLLLPDRIEVSQYLRHEYRKEHFLTFNHPLSMSMGENKYNKLYGIYDDAPVDFVISDLPEVCFGGRELFWYKIRGLYRAEAAYRKVFFDAQKLSINIKDELEKRLDEFKVNEPSVHVPTLKLWHYASS